MPVIFKESEIGRVAISVQAERSNRAPADYWSPFGDETELPDSLKLAKMLRNAVAELGMEPDFIQLAVLNNTSGTQSCKTIRYRPLTGNELYALMIEVIEEAKV